MYFSLAPKKAQQGEYRSSGVVATQTVYTRNDSSILLAGHLAGLWNSCARHS